VVPSQYGENLFRRAADHLAKCARRKGGVTEGLVFEDWERILRLGGDLAASGEITFSPCHEPTAWDRWRCYLVLDVYAHRKNKTVRQHR